MLEPSPAAGTEPMSCTGTVLKRKLHSFLGLCIYLLALLEVPLGYIFTVSTILAILAIFWFQSPPHQALEKSERTRCGLRLPKSKTRGVGAFPVGIRVPFAGAREAGNPPCPPVHALVLQAMGSTHYGIKIAANQARAADTDQRHRQRRCLDAHPRVAHLRQRPPIQ